MLRPYIFSSNNISKKRFSDVRCTLFSLLSFFIYILVLSSLLHLTIYIAYFILVIVPFLPIRDLWAIATMVYI